MDHGQPRDVSLERGSSDAIFSNSGASGCGGCGLKLMANALNALGHVFPEVCCGFAMHPSA